VSDPLEDGALKRARDDLAHYTRLLRELEQRQFRLASQRLGGELQDAPELTGEVLRHLVDCLQALVSRWEARA